MTQSWAVILTALVYLCLLFAIAHWGDVAGRRLMRRRARGTIYALALAVYCTSWTFYGSVGLASRAGLDFLTIYIGPILVIGIGAPLVMRILRIAKAQNITSVADFVAARYGKSESVAALVCVIALVGTVPYIALQLKAVSSSLSVFLTAQDRALVGAGVPGFLDLALVVALVLAGFAVAFGTRHADATEHQDGLVLAVAVESIVKLSAFLAVGIFVVYGMFGGFQDIVDRFHRDGPVDQLLGPTSSAPNFLTLILLSACASLLLPRQFHMTVVENRSPDDLRQAAWLFPLYLVAINVFVVPIALAGLHVLPGSADRDMAVLALPLKEGASFLALVTFVGGLSAATAMVIVDTVAVSIMVSNHLVMPLVLRRRSFAARGGLGGELRNLGGLVLLSRRLAIAAITLLGYLYYRVAGDNALASIGLLSFAAIAQIAPPFVGGLFWRRGTAAGANAGLAVGIALWAYTLLLPVLVSGTSWAGILRDGPFGIAALAPTTLFGTDLTQLTHGTLWSLGLNTLTYVVVSLMREGGVLERIQAAAFVGDRPMPISPALRILRSNVTVDELKTAVGRFLGHDRTDRSFAGYARSRGLALDGRGEADIHLLRYAEHLLASAIGAGSSRLALSLVLRRRNLSGRHALQLLDEASAAMKHNRDLLQHALDHAQQGITVYDSDLRLLAWNQSFIELYSFPTELVRIGIGLEEIIRINAERGLYGEGRPDEMIAQRLHAMLHEEGPVRVRLSNRRVISVRSNKLPAGGLIALYTDVSASVAEEEERERENENLEARVRERTEELTRLNEELRLATAAADKANVSKTRFLAAASHDILQPLNAARLYATAFLERTGHTPDAQLAENIDASLDAVEEILTTLLDISRLDSGALAPEYSAVALDEMFRQLEREFAPVAREKGIALRFVPTSLVVRSDRRLLRRLVQNLVSNGIKYTLSGKVLVGVRRRGEAVRLEVRDTGLGIPADQQRAVFREFERLPEGARAARGIGLGLSIVDRITKALGIEVELRSAPGRGSAFCVALPVTRAPPIAERRQAPRSPVTPLRDLSVVAIDNEPAVRDGMQNLLAGWGCEIVAVASLAEALATIEALPGPPDVLIADYHLDEGDGLAAIGGIRARLGRDLPAILITADRSPELAEAASASQVAVLNKPLKPAALRALLGRLRATRIAAE